MTKAHLEALLFASAKPLNVRELAGMLCVKETEASAWIEDLQNEYASDERGVRIVVNGREAQLVSAPATREIVEKFLEEEITGELTRPQLETLTIVAYRGPVSKPEIEKIRGINCTLILRNLLQRGLVEETEFSTDEIPVYQVTTDFVRFLGLGSVLKLPEYDELHICEVS